jgi:hypothetical protein
MKRTTKTVTVKTRTTTTTKRTRVVKEEEPLVFGKGNAKLKDIHTFSLPSGWTCPMADQCLAKANRETGKVADGPRTEFRCFSASQEALYPSVRNARWYNLSLLKGRTMSEMADLILSSLPRKATTVRIHVAGDFFSLPYLDAWLVVARERPDVLFYAYTKSLSLWVARKGVMPTNFVLTASHGGREDHLIDLHGLRSAKVVYSEREAADLGLEIDHDDSHAMNAVGGDFALLIHGSQPKGSVASKAIAALRAQGEFGYGETADKRRAQSGRVALAMAY